MTVLPFTLKLPVILTLPVNWWVLDSRLPNTVDPVMYSLEDVISWTISV
jgi:hypothetical protein